jgi:fumarate hydratase class II
MMPVIAHNVLQSQMILGNAARTFRDKAVAGFVVNREHIAGFVEQNPMLVTALSPVIGYDKAAQIAKMAYAQGRRVRDVAAAQTDLPAEELDRLLDPRRMT